MADLAALVGARIRAARKRRGWSARQLAAESGVGLATVTRAGLAEGCPNLESAAKMAATLGMSLDALVAPSPCETCDGVPPAGFKCTGCGRTGDG